MIRNKYTKISLEFEWIKDKIIMLVHKENTILTSAYMNQPVFFMFIFVFNRVCMYSL